MQVRRILYVQKHIYTAGVLALALCFSRIGAEIARAADEVLPPGSQVAALESQPPAIELHERFDYRQVLITATLTSGEHVDVTRMAKLDKAADCVDVSPTGLVRPKADGKAELKFSLAGQSVVDAGERRRASRRPIITLQLHCRHVMPTISKLGCNAGTCHGSAQGKNGFKLSLRGYDPVFDHLSLTDDLSARRFNRVMPEQSLMLLKPTASVPHVGGMVTKPGEPSYELLKSWITQGAQFDRDAGRVTKIEVQPAAPIIPLPKMKQQFRVLATYGDGRVRDVSAEAFVESGNIELLEADKHGLITALRRGEAPVLVRYEGNYAAATITVMGDRSGFVWQSPSENNYIDHLVYEKLQRVKTAPASDLSLTGRRVHPPRLSRSHRPAAVVGRRAGLF